MYKDVEDMVKKTLILQDIKLPGMNQQIDAAKRSPKAYAQMKKDNTNLIIRELIKQDCVPAKPYKAIRVNYEFYEGEGPRDPDNCLAGLKFIHDAFVSTGIISDDNIYRIGFGNIGFMPGDEWKIVVTWTVETNVLGNAK